MPFTKNNPKDKLYQSKGGKTTLERYGIEYILKKASNGGIKSGEARRAKAQERAEKAEKLIHKRGR